MDVKVLIYNLNGRDGTILQSKKDGMQGELNRISTSGTLVVGSDEVNIPWSLHHKPHTSIPNPYTINLKP
jgi:hypothetical protein